MTVLIRIFDETGTETRRCDGRCHRADPYKPSKCCCGGLLRGCEIEGAEINWTYVEFVRETITLNRGEHVQMGIGS
jgi:hypothetical protein